MSRWRRCGSSQLNGKPLQWYLVQSAFKFEQLVLFIKLEQFFIEFKQFIQFQQFGT